MAKDELSGEQMTGCLLSIWSLFVTGPIWLVLMFVVLNALGDAIPTWGWVLYWIYVPATILGILTGMVGKQLLASK